MNTPIPRRTALVLLLAPVAPKVMSMPLFNPTRTCVFSAVKARLSRNGEPLKGALVIRRWKSSHSGEDKTRTDAQGALSFPAVFESFATRLMPVELAIAQELCVVVGGKEEVFWVNSKREPEENVEFRGRPISLVCEMSREMVIRDDLGPNMFTLCEGGST